MSNSAENLTIALSWPDRLFSPGPKRILSIDGGGVRGAVAIAFLKELEHVLQTRYGRPNLRLCDYFDLIGGTSVGAILAAGLALGASAEEAAQDFRYMGPRLFRQYLPRLPLFQARFDPKRIEHLLREQFGAQTLGNAAWKTGFAAIAKRVDTGSSWVLTNCPKSRYWDGDPDEIANEPDRTKHRVTPNRDYELAKVVQSSAAAPVYFDLVSIEVSKGEAGVFFDGAMTPHGNPALQLAKVALIPAYGLSWAPGKDELLIVSVGTGGPRPKKPGWVKRPVASIWKALHALVSIAYDTSQLAISMLQWLGHSPQPWHINSEEADHAGAAPAFHRPLWTFLRYDAPLQQDWLKTHIGRDYSDREIAVLQRLDDEKQIEPLFDIGTQAARLQIRPEHFEDVFAPHGG